MRNRAAAFCPYTSSDSGAVKRHERKHTGERPAKCDYPGCSFAARDYSNLKRHMLTVRKLRKPPALAQTNDLFDPATTFC